MKNKIIEKVAELCIKAGVPSINSTFNLKGKVAGQFSAKGDAVELQFNMIFATNHPEEYMARTVIHEVAHYVRYARNGFTGDRQANGKRDMHGAKWRAVMLELGATDITRTHKYDVSVIQTRKMRRFEYACDHGHTYQLTTIRHNRSNKWLEEGGHKWYTCRECSSQLRLI